MEGNEEAGMLAMIIILEYSFDYWVEFHNTKPGEAQLRFLKKVWKAIKTAGADTWGFLAGGWYVDEKGDTRWNSGRALKAARTLSDRQG